MDLTRDSAGKKSNSSGFRHSTVTLRSVDIRTGTRADINCKLAGIRAVPGLVLQVCEKEVIGFFPTEDLALGTPQVWHDNTDVQSRYIA